MSSIARVIFWVVATEFRLSRNSRRLEAIVDQPRFARTIWVRPISSESIGSNSS